MGMHYGYELVVARDAIDSALDSLAGKLSHDDRVRLREALPWAADSGFNYNGQNQQERDDCYGIKDLSIRSHERFNSYCFSLLLPTTPETEAQNLQAGLRIRGQEDGLEPVGCWWTSVRAGRTFAGIECRASTSKVSSIALSRDAREQWQQIAKNCLALALFLDTEGQDWELLYPEVRTISRPEYGRPEPAVDPTRSGVDDYYRQALYQAEDVSSSPPA